MSFFEEKKYTFDKNLVLKGTNKVEGKTVNGKWVRTNPELTLVREFTKGTVVPAKFISGRGGANINIVSDGGLLPDGSNHVGEVTYTMVFNDTNFKDIKLDSLGTLPKVAETPKEADGGKELRGGNKTNNPYFLGAMVLVAVIGGFLIYKSVK